MLPDGTGGLVSWAEAEDVVQAMPVSVAAVNRARRIGDFIGLLGEALVGEKGGRASSRAANRSATCSLVDTCIWFVMGFGKPRRAGTRALPKSLSRSRLRMLERRQICIISGRTVLPHYAESSFFAVPARPAPSIP